MSSTHPRRGDPIARDVRPLPSAPSLEFERKAAKALLKLIHGGNPGALSRVKSVHAGALRDELDAKRPSPPTPDERMTRVMLLAADDAARQNQKAVTTENMLVGHLRAYNGVFAEAFMASGTDMPKLRALIGERLLPDSDPLVGQDLSVDDTAAAALQVATAEAESRRREQVDPHHLLLGILSQDTGPAVGLLVEVRTNLAQLRERLTEWV